MEVYVYLYENGEPLSVEDLSGPEIDAIQKSLGKYGNLDVFTNEDYAVMEDFNEAEFNKAEKKFNEPFVITPRRLGLNRWGEVKVVFRTSVVPLAPFEDLPVINIPKEQTDAITFADIPDGTRMVDFHGEKARHRYYTEATYNALNPKKNPFNRKDILPGDVTRYIAKLDPTMPVQEAGRRRRKVTSKKAAKKTCASGYAVYNYRKTRKGVFYDCAPKRKTRRRHK